MKLCQECWNELKEAIEQRGLMHLVAKGGEEAVKQIDAQLSGDTSARNYDPLMAANFAIWNQSLSSFGLGMMAPDAPCPLCHKTEIESVCTDPSCNKQSGHDWIRFAADDQLAYSRHHGLVPQAH